VTTERRPFPHRFRRRLALICTATTALATALFGIGAFLFIRADRIDRFEAAAGREASLAVMALDRDSRSADAAVDALSEVSRAGLVAVTDGAVDATAGLSAASVPSVLRERTIGSEDEPMLVRSGRHLVVATATPDGDRYFFFFDHLTVDADIEAVARVLVVSWVAVVLAAAALSQRVAKRTLWPVRRAADAANDLASGLLRTRLPVEGEDEFAAWASSFNRMVDELERRIAREQRLTADVAHELRTPLGSLLTAATMIEQHADRLPPEVRRPAELTVQELRRLRRLVEDLLEMARLEGGQEQLVVSDVEVRERIRELLASRGWSRSVDVLGRHVRVRTDPRRLDRILGNLVENAVRHGRPPVVVEVRDHVDGVVVEVRDAGEGVPDHEVGSLFEPFFKRDRSRSGPGTGLGLAIAAEHARVLGARLEAFRRPDGMVFRLEMHGAREAESDQSAG
jgi:signal transduction histidine kinase